MNLTQNDRLKQVTSDTLIVGVDVGSQTHFCRAFDWRGFELSRRVFKFSNTGMGFLTFLRWTEELMNKTEMKKVIVGCEPTGCYWLTFQKFLQDHDIQLVTVNPFTVNRRLSIDRDSKYFKRNYSLRTECERYNSRFKNTGQERMWVRNKSSVANLNTLAHISLLAVAVATITTGTGQSYRKLKAVKRIA